MKTNLQVLFLHKLVTVNPLVFMFILQFSFLCFQQNLNIHKFLIQSSQMESLHLYIINLTEVISYEEFNPFRYCSLAMNENPQFVFLQILVEYYGI